MSATFNPEKLARINALMEEFSAAIAEYEKRLNETMKELSATLAELNKEKT